MIKAIPSYPKQLRLKDCETWRGASIAYAGSAVY